MFRINKVPLQVANSLDPGSTADGIAGASSTNGAGQIGLAFGGAASSGMKGMNPNHIVWGRLESSGGSSYSNPSEQKADKAMKQKLRGLQQVEDAILFQSGSSSGTLDISISDRDLCVPLEKSPAAPSFGAPEKTRAALRMMVGDDDNDDDVGDYVDDDELKWQGEVNCPEGRLKQLSLDQDGNFCHPLVVAPRRKRKCKDGKSKRDRYRKFREEMMSHIEAAPDDFNFDIEVLPECIAKDERLKGKLLTRLKIYQEQLQNKKLSL